jgi:hypothetical protein
MKRALGILIVTVVSMLSLAGCTALRAKAPGSQVGKASTPSSSGFLDMPFLTTLSEEDARQTLADSQMTGNIKIEYTECNDKSIGPGHVCNTYPGGGDKTTTTSDVTLFVVPE